LTFYGWVSFYFLNHAKAGICQLFLPLIKCAGLLVEKINNGYLIINQMFK